MAETPREGKRTGKTPGREAPGGDEKARREGMPDADVDPREEEGWDQPQSSAQKGPNATGEPEG